VLALAGDVAVDVTVGGLVADDVGVGVEVDVDLLVN
jgi:hypothetical protein